MEKKTLCLYFQVHQPIRFRKYQFFDIGKRHDYCDEFANRTTIQRLAQHCYLPANNILLELIRKYGTNFKVSFSISGPALELFEKYAPEVINSFKALAATGCVEFLAETYAHSLSSLADEKEFKSQVNRHADLTKSLFGQKPETFRNTELIYSDEIGEIIAKMGYTAMLTEGAKHILGWKSPNFIYTNTIHPKLKLLLNNFSLSDDLAFRFSNKSWDQWPLTAEKYTRWIMNAAEECDIINLFLNYETFGEYNTADSGIFSFLESLPHHILATSAFEFLTPKEAVKKHQPVAPLNVPFPISWSDEERDVTSWLGNELQEEAFDELYKIRAKVDQINDPVLNHDYNCMQESDHLFYMCTKLFGGCSGRGYKMPYASPYEAFINYMNVLSDFIDRVDRKDEELKKAPLKKASPKSSTSKKQ